MLIGGVRRTICIFAEKMQKRHTDRKLYFRELERTSTEFYIDYVSDAVALSSECRILEVGCGEGGNLVPFAKMGCDVAGIDISKNRINEAKEYFAEITDKAKFMCCDFLKYPVPSGDKEKYDVILLHDVIEHISAKEPFLVHLKEFLKPDGVLFIGFPAWQMPFGGHQQICRSKVCSHLPFIHLLPKRLYRVLLKCCGEQSGIVDELISIKECGTSIELFERIVGRCEYKVAKRTFWFINPHYKQKFNLAPRHLWGWMYGLGYIRNFFTTSCWYLLRS